MKSANYAPVYCALYPQFAEIARKHGYAMAVHGSLGRDFDLICIPWIENPARPEVIVNEITTTFAVKTVGEPDTTFHGRQRWTLSIGFGECAIDLQFMPQAGANPLSGPLADALVDLYKQIKHANDEVAHEMDPLFDHEIAAIDRLLNPDLIDRLNLDKAPCFCPAVFQTRMRSLKKKDAGKGWSGWEDCSVETYAHIKGMHNDENYEYEVRKLYIRTDGADEGVVDGTNRTTSGAIGQP